MPTPAVHSRLKSDEIKMLERRIGFNRTIWWIVNIFIEKRKAYLNYHNVTWVMKASRMLNLKGLIQHRYEHEYHSTLNIFYFLELEIKCKYFIDRLCGKNGPLVVYVAARRYGHYDMWKAALKHIRVEFLVISKSTDFNNLPAAYLVEILTDSYLRINRQVHLIFFEGGHA